MYYLNRTLCDVLEEMRKLNDTRNYGALIGLIEEAQSMGNRMEASLRNVRDIKRMEAQWRELRKEINELEEKAKTLRETVGEPKNPHSGSAATDW
jgi:predicted  nucleic acid-binding Zn-ribbon protein